MKWLLLFCLLIPGAVPAQQEGKLMLYNAGFGGLSAGIGAVINKKEGSNWKKCFVRGFWQGSIGGMLNYSSKKTLYLMNREENFAYALPARFLNCAGNSIIVNAATNQPFGNSWFFEYGILRMDYNIREKHFQFRALPAAVAATVVSATKGKFDWNTTLLTGVMSFARDSRLPTERKRVDGINYGRAFIYQDSANKYHVVGHEVIHEFQYREYLVFNAYLKKTAASVKSPVLQDIFRKYVYPDLPYFGVFYMIEGVTPSPHFYKNFYEFEAERLSTNKFVEL